MTKFQTSIHTEELLTRESRANTRKTRSRTLARGSKTSQRCVLLSQQNTCSTTTLETLDRILQNTALGLYEVFVAGHGRFSESDVVTQAEALDYVQRERTGSFVAA